MVKQMTHKGLVQATPPGKSNAVKFAFNVNPQGATNTPEAMKVALEQAEKYDVETIFLLTDGAPFAGGRYLDLEEVRRGITERNEFLGVRINTIGMFSGAAEEIEGNRTSRDEPPKHELADFLRGIAAENDGRFVEVLPGR